MITKKMYDLDEIRQKPFPQSETQTFTKNDFVQGTEDESITIVRAKKNETLDPYIFYLQSMLKIHPEISSTKDFMDTETQATPVTEEMFLGIAQTHLEGLKENYAFSLHGQFVDAMKMVEKWNVITLLCETTEEIIFFNWNTTP